MIIKEGHIASSWGDLTRVDMTFSVTKSYLSAVAGVAWDKGLIHSTDDKMTKYVWDRTFDGEHNSKITWEHLLNQSSDWSGTLFGMEDWEDRPPREGDIDDWRMRELHEPGTHYKYNDVRVNLLAYSLLQVWRNPLPQVLKNEIMDPIGASTTWRWFGYDNSFVMVDGIEMQSVVEAVITVADFSSVPTIMPDLDCCLLEMAYGMVKKLSHLNGLASLLPHPLPIHAMVISGGCRMMKIVGKMYRITSTTLPDSEG